MSAVFSNNANKQLSLFTHWVHLSFSLSATRERTHAAMCPISPREKRISTTPRSPVRPWKPSLFQLLPSRLWARPHPLNSAGPPAVLLLPQDSRSLQLTGPGPTPAPDPAWAGPAHSASLPPAAFGRSTRSISIRWGAALWVIKPIMALTQLALTIILLDLHKRW